VVGAAGAVGARELLQVRYQAQEAAAALLYRLLVLGYLSIHYPPLSYAYDAL
jgi:hypothetical protein